jgi:hypothetical protein
MIIEEYITSKEIADTLSLKHSTVSARIRYLGIEPAYTFGRAHLYHKNVLELVSNIGQRGGDRKSKKTTDPTP